jgi:hypothetical protein
MRAPRLTIGIPSAEDRTDVLSGGGDHALLAACPAQPAPPTQETKYNVYQGHLDDGCRPDNRLPYHGGSGVARRYSSC